MYYVYIYMHIHRYIYTYINISVCMCVYWPTISPSHLVVSLCDWMYYLLLPAIEHPTIRMIITRHYNTYKLSIPEPITVLQSFFGDEAEIAWDTGDLPDTGSPPHPKSRRRSVKSLIKSSNWYPRQQQKSPPIFSKNIFPDSQSQRPVGAMALAL